VANAIIDGTDAIMLSGESASGKYPVESCNVMLRIAKEVEPFLKPELIFSDIASDVATDALTKAAFQLAFDMGDKLKAIVVLTNTGGTAHLLGRYNLPQPIYAFVRESEQRLRLTMSKGINTTYPMNRDYKDRDSALNAIIEEIKERKLVEKEDSVLIIGNAYVTSSHFPNLFEIVKI
jgi:pyruvate kinase